MRGPLINGEVTVDNFGNTYTGLWNGSINLKINDLLGYGETIFIWWKRS
jgi:hemolysin activation/secretion protein